MSILEDSRYSAVSALIADFADEVVVHKTVAERSFAAGESYAPMCIFYASPTQKDYLVVVAAQDSFAKTLPKISQVMHLYASRDSYCVLIVMASKILIDENIYDSINFFVASHFSAYVYYLPYTISSEDSTPVWHDDLSFIDELATANLDQNGIDFVNLLHAHINVAVAPFEAAEVLNYLSYHGFAIQSMNETNPVHYIDMSTFEYHSV